MPRIALFQLMQEISSFNPGKSHLDDFLIQHGEPWIAADRGSVHEIGGALSVFEADSEVVLIPTSAHAATHPAASLQPMTGTCFAKN